MQDLLLVGPALQLSDFLDLCRAAKPESVLFIQRRRHCG